jgi:tetratricopeptide (TPR) repeat protein
MTAQELYDTGFAARCDGRYREAKLYLEQVVSMDPHHTKAHWQLALIKGFEGDFDGSLADLKRLNQQNPSDLDILNDLGMTYNMLGYPDEACETFARILSINPDHENARRQLAYC